MAKPSSAHARQASDAEVEKLLDQQLPFDVEAEQGVLGSMLLLSEACDDVAGLVRADDFYVDANRRLFQHLMDLHNEGQAIDALLLVDRLRTAGDYDVCGGAAYIGRLSGAVPRIANAVRYAKIVREKSSVRQLIHASAEILREAYSEASPAVEMLNRAEQRVFSILDRQETSAVSSVSEILNRAMERIDARLSGEHADGGVETGYTQFDALTGGLHNGELVILAARPSMGKTALALNIAENVSIKFGEPTLVVSLEMSSLELGERMLCSVSRVNGHRLRNGTLTREDRARLVETSAQISESPLFVDDSPSRTVTEIAAAARRIKRRQGKLGLIVIDYLQLIEPDNSLDPRQEQVAKIARRLKGLARELELPVLCLSQLNRQADGSKDELPKLSQLRESGAIEQDADVVMFVHRRDYGVTDPNEPDTQQANALIRVAKQRNGPIGDVDLMWLRDYTRFENAETREEYQEFNDFNNRSLSAAGIDQIDG